MDNGAAEKKCTSAHCADCESSGLRAGLERCRGVLRHWISSNVRSSFSLKVDFESSVALLLLYAGIGYYVGTAALEAMAK